MKNDIIDIRRFGRYLVADIKSSIAQLGWMSLAAALIGLATYIFAGTINMLTGNGWVGIGVGVRIGLFIMALTIVLILGPEMIYGKWTDVKAGRFRATLPASSLEKTASMILNASVLFPLLIAVAYLAVDAIICLVDRNCGATVIGTIGTGMSEFAEMMASEGMPESIKSLLNPLLLIDDIIQTSLIFLLGAVVFKKHKTIKTILCMIGLSMVLSTVSIPIITEFIGANWWNMDSSAVMEKFEWVFRHGALIDTINDTILNCALAAGIYYRVRTIKF